MEFSDLSYFAPLIMPVSSPLRSHLVNDHGSPRQTEKIPYGEADFSVIRNEDYAFVDNTRFIEVLEDCGSRFPFIIRPRRFGKSLVTSMMMKYYDKASDTDFDRYFHGTYIGSHKTPSAN